MIRGIIFMALAFAIPWAPAAGAVSIADLGNSSTGFSAAARKIALMQGVDEEEKERLVQTLALFQIMGPGEAANRSTMEILDQVRRLRVSLGQTSLLAFNQDIPSLRSHLQSRLDQIKQYAATLSSMERIMGGVQFMEKVKGYWDWSQQARGALTKFQGAGYRDLNPQTRAALSYLHWVGEQIQTLGGNTPLVGRAVEAYGSFLSTVSQALADNATRLITGLRGGRLMAGMHNFELTLGFSRASGGGIPAVTEVLKATDWNVILLMDDNTRGDLKPSYYLKVAENGDASDWVKVKEHLVKAVVADWLAAYHRPRDPKLAALWSKIPDFEQLRGSIPRERAMGSFPTGREILFLIDPHHASARRVLPTRGLNRQHLRKLARQGIDLLADAEQMDEAYRGLAAYEGGRAFLRDFRDNRRYLRMHCRDLLIPLDPRMENALLRQYLIHGGSRIEQALRSQALKNHPGAVDWLRCQNRDPYSMDLPALGKWLAAYRHTPPFDAAKLVILDKAQRMPIKGAQVRIAARRSCGVKLEGFDKVFMAGPDGAVDLVLPLGCFAITFSAPGYESRSTGRAKPFCLTDDKGDGKPVVIYLSRAQAPPSPPPPRYSGRLDCECVHRVVVRAAQDYYRRKCADEPRCSDLVWLGSRRYASPAGTCGVELRYRFRRADGGLTDESTKRKAYGAGDRLVQSCVQGTAPPPPRTEPPRANPCAHNPGCGDCRGLSVSGPCMQWCLKCSKIRSR